MRYIRMTYYDYYLLFVQRASPTHTLPGIHDKAGVTHVCHHAGYVYSAGRDGTYRQYRIRGTRLHMMNTFKVALTYSDDFIYEKPHHLGVVPRLALLRSSDVI